MILTPQISKILTGRNIITALVVLVLGMFVSFDSVAQVYHLGTYCGGGAGNTYSNHVMTDRGSFWQTRIQEDYSTTAGTRMWEFEDNIYYNTWRAPTTTPINIAGHNIVIPPDVATASAFWRFGAGNGGDGARMLATTSGYYYTFNIQEKGYANSYMAVLETAYDPKTISVSDAVAPYGGRTATVTLSAAPAAGEFVYIRYTTDNYTTSTIIPVSFTGNVGTAIVPVPSTSGVIQKYYAYSSPKTKAEIDAQVVTYGQVAHDMLTLELSNGVQNDFNYQVVVTSSGGNKLMNTYQTMLAAFTAINGGTNHTGVITIALIGNTTETASAVLIASGTGSASYTSVGIQPAGGAARTITGNPSAPLINLNGADNVTIDGREGGTGTTKSLTISNTSTNAAATSILLTNDAQGNTLRYLIVKGRAMGSAGSGVVVIDAAGGTGGNDNLLIDHCDVDATASALNCIYAIGTATAINNSVTVSNCNLYDYRGDASAGINLAAYNQDWTIAYNSFYQTTAYAGIAGVTYGLYIGANGASSNTQIYNNFIGGSGANCAGTWTINGTATSFRFVGMYLNFGSSAGSKVYNNTIVGFSWFTNSSSSGSQGIWAGIFLNSGSVNIGTDGANTIGSSIGNGNITVTLNSGNRVGAIYGIATESSAINNLNIENNSILSITALLGGVITNSVISIYPVYVRNSAGTCNISNNLIGSNIPANSINAASPNVYAQTVTGIFSSTTGSISITNNSISYLNNPSVSADVNNFNRGIHVTASTGTVTITGNLVSDITASQPMTGTGASSNIIGISMEASTASGVTVSGNTVYNLKNTDPSTAVNVIGMYYNGPVAGTNKVEKNFIYSLSVSSASASATITGLRINAGTTTFSNNIISIGASIPNGNIIYGIYENGAALTTNSLYHNTIYIGGTAAAAANTASFYSNTSNNARNFRNNIFVNARSGSGGSHYAAFFNYGVNTGITLEYNTYYAPNTGGVLGRYNGSNITALPLIPLKDLNSTTSNPQFTLAGGTTPANYIPTAPSGGANNTGIATDYANMPRNCAYTMGAFEVEVTVGTPVFTLGPTSTRCQGAATVTYTATATASTGITYSLDAASTSAGNIINAATGAVIYVSGWLGPSTITAFASGCNGPSAPATHTVTITTAPAAPTGTSPQVLCTGQTVAALTVTTGTNIQWYAAASGGSALPASTVLVNNTTYYASQTVGCESVDRLPVTVQLVANTAVSAITGNPTPCSNTAGLVYSVTNLAGTAYTWTVPPGWSVAFGQGSNSVTITSGGVGQNGNITVSAVNTCGTTTSNLGVSITAPDAYIVPNYCTGTDGVIDLTAFPEPSTDYTYQWFKDGAPITGATSRFLTVNQGALYKVTVKNTANCSASADISLATELVVNGNFNSGNFGFTSDYQFKPDVAGNTELVPEGTYGVGPDPQAYHFGFWGLDHSSPGGGGNFMIINGQANTMVWSQQIDNLVIGTTYYFSAWAVGLNNTDNAAMLQFKVNGVLAGDWMKVNLRSRADNSPPFAWKKFYGSWKATATTAILEIVDVDTYERGNDFGLDDISFGSLKPTYMDPTATANANQVVCKGGTLNLSVDVNGGRAPYTYAWRKDSDPTIIATTPNYTISPVAEGDAGTYTVSITDYYGVCGAKTASTIVTVLPMPSATISGGVPNEINTVCLNDASPLVTFTGSGSVRPYTFTYTLDGTEYTISTEEGSDVTTLTLPNVAHDYTYTLTSVKSSNGCSQPQTDAVAFSVKEVSAAISSSAVSICVGSQAPTITFTGSGTGSLPPYTFNYTLNSVAQSITTVSGNTITIDVPAAANTYEYILESVTASGCTRTASGTVKVTVNPLPVISLTGNTPVCTGTPTVYSTEPGMSNYVWPSSVSGGNITPGTGTSASPSITITWTTPAGARTLSVNYTDKNGCTATSPKELAITVNTVPAQPGAITPSTSSVCTPQSGVAYSVNSVTGATSYNWVIGGTGANINNGSTNNITIDYATNASTGSRTLTVRAVNLCGQSNSRTGIITVYAGATANAGSDQTLCANGTITLNGSIGGSATSATWSAASGTFSNFNLLNSTYTPGIANGNVALTLTTNKPANCPAGVSTVFFTIAHQWNGASDFNWSNAGNWGLGCGIPGSANDVLIPSSGVTRFPEVNITNAVCRNLTINNPATLQINAGQALTVNGNLTNNGTFTIKSDALDNNGSLIVNGSGTGNVTYNRYLTPTGTPPGRWFIASSPVNTSAGGFDGSNIIRNGTTDYDFAPYIEPFNEGWRYQVTLPTSLNNGQGYLARVGATPNLSFTGPLNSSPVLVPVTNSPSSPGVYDNGWNAVGNPFTSAIGITSGTTTQNFLAVNDGILETGYKAIYLWYQTLPVTDQNFRVINNVGYTGNQYGGINLDNYVQAGQGFLVNVNANGNIIFTKGTTGMQVHRPAATTFKSAQTSWPGVTLLAGSNGRTRNTVVAFNQNMTTGLDPSYDAGLLAASDFNLYTRLLDGSSQTDFTIQCLPDAMYETYAVPVGIDMPQPGNLTFKASGVILPDGLYPVIEDRLLQVSTPLKTETDSLTVDIPEATWGPGRFYLSFSENAIHTGTITQNPVKKYTATYTDRKIILFGAPEPGSRAWLYDMNGRLLGGEYRLTSTNRNEIPAAGLSPGIYLLKVTGNTTRQTLKITVLNL